MAKNLSRLLPFLMRGEVPPVDDIIEIYIEKIKPQQSCLQKLKDKLRNVVTTQSMDIAFIVGVRGTGKSFVMRLLEVLYKDDVFFIYINTLP